MIGITISMNNTNLDDNIESIKYAFLDKPQKFSALFIIFCAFLALTFILGGANENDYLANVILEYLSLPVLALSIYVLLTSETRKINAVYIIYGILCILLFLLIQLMPLSESTWRSLPFHDLAAKGLSIVDIKHPSGPLSLAPYLTWVSFLSFLPPLAIFLGVLSLNSNERKALVYLVLTCGIANAFLGLIQFSLNSVDGAYLYPNKNPSEILGFFKNRNHFSSIMYAMIPYSMALSASALTSHTRNKRHPTFVDNMPLLLVGQVCLFIFIVCCVMARSRAGLIILMLALIWTAFLPRWKSLGADSRIRGGKHYKKYFIFILLFALLFALEFGFSRLLDRFETDPLQDARVRISRNTFHAALTAFPYGTGLGTFQNIYAATEPVRDVISHKFANRAHNDYLEFILETGAFGFIIIICFYLWYLIRLFFVWFSDSSQQTNSYLARAASITIGLLLLHSFVDYPLRTQAMMGLFALSCALLARIPPEIQGHERDQSMPYNSKLLSDKYRNASPKKKRIRQNISRHSR